AATGGLAARARARARGRGRAGPATTVPARADRRGHVAPVRPIAFAEHGELVRLGDAEDRVRLSCFHPLRMARAAPPVGPAADVRVPGVQQLPGHAGDPERSANGRADPDRGPGISRGGGPGAGAADAGEVVRGVIALLDALRLAERW